MFTNGRESEAESAAHVYSSNRHKQQLSIREKCCHTFKRSCQCSSLSAQLMKQFVSSLDSTCASDSVHQMAPNRTVLKLFT